MTHLAFLIRPYHAGGRGEIVQQPKVYGFDTGFVSFYKVWQELHERDRGLLWEHLVFEALLARFGERGVYTWRDKQKREIDFVLPGPEGHCHAIECKWDGRDFSVRGFSAFRAPHPRGGNFVLSPQADSPYLRDIGEFPVVFCTLEQWDAG